MIIFSGWTFLLSPSQECNMCMYVLLSRNKKNNVIPVNHYFTA